MGRHGELPDELGTAFPVRLARLHGISRSRLSGRDLRAPFHGMRLTAEYPDAPPDHPDPYERQRAQRVHAARLHSAVLHPGHFFSHQTAASIWGAPLPLELDAGGMLAEYDTLALHVSARGATPFPRAAAVTGHRTLASMTSLREHEGMRLTSPAATWVALGTLSFLSLVELGDYFCRRWRTGVGRPHSGRRPLATVDELRSALEAGRRVGAARLREALDAIREDSWSPRESRVRCILVAAGLPEPALNVDLFDEHSDFLGCTDMAYREQKVAVEYMGMLHGEQWARDVERLAALRAAGWIVIEVTAPLLHTPERLVARVRDALRRRSAPFESHD